MGFLFKKNNALPQLAWCARCSPSHQQVEIEHGAGVEVCGDFFFEGAWNGGFSAEEYLAASIVAGTGGGLIGDKVCFVPGSDRISPVFSITNSSGTYISNSAFFALASAREQLDQWYPFYFYDLLRYWRMGLHCHAGPLRLASGRTIMVHFFTKLILESEGGISYLPHDPGPRPTSYESYHAILLDGLKAVFTNASDSRRTRHLRPLAAMSRGYDSSATASLAARAGCREAYTFHDSRAEKCDNAKANAALLGMECREYDRWEHTRMPEVNDAEFAMVGTAVLTPLAALGDKLQDRLLVTGDYGEIIWGPVESGCCENLTIPWARFLGGFGHSEFRLRTGFHILAPASIASRHSPAIHRISWSEEMKPWWVEGAYNRPIPRRIAEEAGLPRDQFGVNKNASSHSTYRDGIGFNAEGQRSYLDFIGSREAGGERVKQLYWKARFNTCHFLWKWFSTENRLHKKYSCWHRHLPYLFNTTPRINSWTYQFTFQWSEYQLRPRYSAPATSGDAMPEARHWAKSAYQLPRFKKRLSHVRKQIADALHECPTGPLKIISLCSGDGRDVLDVLPGHPRKDDTSCLLIDSSSEAIADALQAVTAAGLEERVKCIHGNASLFENCSGFVPANLVIISGVFFHLSAVDAEKLLGALPMLCAPGAFVIWNRRQGRRDFSLTLKELRNRFIHHGFVAVEECSTGEKGFWMARERFGGDPKPFVPGPSLFRFVVNPRTV